MSPPIMMEPILIDISLFPPWAAVAVAASALAAILVSGAALIVACSAKSTARGIEKTRYHFVTTPQDQTTVEEELSKKDD